MSRRGILSSYGYKTFYTVSKISGISRMPSAISSDWTRLFQGYVGISGPKFSLVKVCGNAPLFLIMTAKLLGPSAKLL